MVTGHPKKLFSRGHPQALINSTNIPPIMIINRIYETQNLLSLQLVNFLGGLRTYQHLWKLVVWNSNFKSRLRRKGETVGGCLLVNVPGI